MPVVDGASGKPKTKSGACGKNGSCHRNGIGPDASPRQAAGDGPCPFGIARFERTPGNLVAHLRAESGTRQSKMSMRGAIPEH